MTIKNAIETFENENLIKFQPEKSFYLKMGINRIRFWQLVRNEKQLTIEEAQRLADFFKIPVTNFLTKNPLTGANCQGV